MTFAELPENRVYLMHLGARLSRAYGLEVELREERDARDIRGTRIRLAGRMPGSPTTHSQIVDIPRDTSGPRFDAFELGCEALVRSWLPRRVRADLEQGEAMQVFIGRMS